MVEKEISRNKNCKKDNVMEIENSQFENKQEIDKYVMDEQN